MTETLFISDLHLDPERPAITELFLDLLGGRAARCAGLYILGDLFEAWAGDDDLTPQIRDVLDGLQQLTVGGTPVFLMHGNRDFLIGADFEALTGCRIIPDPTVVELQDKRVLLMHGDTLCIDDEDYMAWRATVRNDRWIREFLTRPLDERRSLVRMARERSRTATRNKPEEIMDVNQGAVVQVMDAHRVHWLIHGHTHRPAFHHFDLHGQPATRIVLGDWYREGSLLAWTDAGGSAEMLPLPG
ncbi:MAG: UDP-2,3-diacylglucosamine diphosphatase [Gammaproteobacteria bacterium]